MLRLLFLLAFSLLLSARLEISTGNLTAEPLQQLHITNAPGTTVVVRDGQGSEYVRVSRTADLTFTVGGALGVQTIECLDAQGRIVEQRQFRVDAQSRLQENSGVFADLFRACERTMKASDSDGTGSISWRGRNYKYFDPWILDHSHTTKGMQYFSPSAADMVDLFGAAQKANGMIWSFAFPDHAPEHQYHYWAYKDQGYAWADDNVLFARQPVENHNEANFVDALYLCWKANGDDRWMQSHLQQAECALDYSVTDPARWSAKYQLLKRGYTIDSWDFQPDDRYLVHFPMGSAQQIDPQRTEFVVFFGDNTGYAHACDQLAEMLAHAGDAAGAQKYRQRATGIRARLDALAWNGNFYTHHIEEDAAVHRDFGVAEAKQLAMSNAYSLNRGVTQKQAEAIIETYQKLRRNLPPGSPGEWYAVYPPYPRGFGAQDVEWQYMNGGVQAHAAGELARGALERGFEDYGADILARLDALTKQHEDKLFFAYTGAFPAPPPAPVYQTIDVSREANMAITGAGEGSHPWMGHGGPNDMRNLPLGKQTLAGIPFDIATNGARAAAGVSSNGSLFPATADVPVGKKSAAVYLLHAAEQIGSSNIAGTLTFRYEDGSSSTVYLFRGKQMASTWFPKLAAPDAGVAWRGANGVCGDVGVSWAALKNPHPDKIIRSLQVAGSEDGSIYALLGVTLADRMPWHPADPVSFGGPDNWSAGLVLYALVHGLAGVDDLSTRFRDVELSPRWPAAKVQKAAVITRYGASDGYVAYQYHSDPAAETIEVRATGDAEHCKLRVLLPNDEVSVREFDVDGKPVSSTIEKVEHSRYAVTECSLKKPVQAVVHYR